MSFSFKQFNIQQDKCAMKVCTDACLFGAWVAAKLGDDEIKANHILDIGTGTGLLSLMLAQQSIALIDAIEIDGQAALQASQNSNASPWKKRINIIHADAKSFLSPKKYDLIISNPPFFENDLRSPAQNKNAAKHGSTLTLSELLNTIVNNISSDGYAAILLPGHRAGHFEQLALKQHLKMNEKCMVKQTPSHTYFRAMILLSNKEKEMKESEIIIHDSERKYTNEFTGLLKDYYLKM